VVMSSVTSTRKPFPIGKVIVPIITIGILIVLWRLNLKWATIPMIFFILFYFLLLPKIIRSRTEKFNRKALMLLTSGKATELPGLVKRSIVLQLFGPRGPLDAKLALAYEQVALQTGLAKALFAAGDLAKAEAEARSIVRNVTRLPELLVIIARSRVGLNKLDDETRRLLDEAETLSPSQDVVLMITLTRIELALLSGRKPGELPEKADAASKLIRSWIHLVRGQLREHRGDEEKASQSYTKAKSVLPKSFVSKAAEIGLERLCPKEPEADQPGKGVDPVIRRKKKRRR
jgi:tetratricopeptide (TPR) repeat protein